MRLDEDFPRATLRDVALPWHAPIARRAAVFRLAVLHHPPFSSGPNAKDPPTPTIKALLPPALAASGVDVALSGHEHFYERTRPIEAIVAGKAPSLGQVGLQESDRECVLGNT